MPRHKRLLRPMKIQAGVSTRPTQSVGFECRIVFRLLALAEKPSPSILKVTLESSG